MKISVLMLFIVVVFGCSSARKVRTSSCRENLEFKAEFFDNILVVEKYTKERKSGIERSISTAAFLQSLNYISKYAPISFSRVSNYEIGYPSYEMFELDKKGWITWYEANKCKNIRK